MALVDSTTQQHDRSVQFYTTDEFLLDDLGDFIIGPALSEGCSAVVVCTKGHLRGRSCANPKKSLRELSLYLLRSQDEGRRHIGREMHRTIASANTSRS
ncbi:MAG TPA: hypothetical protein VNK23_07075 [Candidatus Dormibacteraeota bacterium]|nr:hypothetical protein [Candidatus Dormibacteraeota bacterium]